jgi:hypothetical protein
MEDAMTFVELTAIDEETSKPEPTCVNLELVQEMRPCEAGTHLFFSDGEEGEPTLVEQTIEQIFGLIDDEDDEDACEAEA